MWQKITRKGWTLGNIDVVVMAEQPKIRPYISQMTEKIAETMAVSPQNVSIKATTTEKLGFVGREEGIAAFATVTVVKRS